MFNIICAHTHLGLCVCFCVFYESISYKKPKRVEDINKEHMLGVSCIFLLLLFFLNYYYFFYNHKFPNKFKGELTTHMNCLKQIYTEIVEFYNS